MKTSSSLLAFNGGNVNCFNEIISRRAKEGWKLKFEVVEIISSQPEHSRVSKQACITDFMFVEK
jgi:hypothetical protein